MINFEKIQRKWQTRWKKSKIFEVKEDSKSKKYYILEMYPYPSSYGLHMGHARNYVIGDSFARYKRMQNFNVLYPMGYDSFGLPAENAAIKAKSHPKIFTEKAIDNFIKQQKELGLSYDWSRIIACHKPEYYHWDQWIFLKLYEKGLAYKRKAAVNYCSKCNTVLANEQVINGKCWRHEDTDVEVKELDQWFFKITDYADKLLRDIDKLQWSEDVKQMQRNWIGRKEWIDVDYQIEGTDKKITVSTTRPDTNYGATFVIVAPEHPILSKEAGLISEEYGKDVQSYIKYAKKKTEEERIDEKRRKSGVFTGLYCINKLTNKRMPVWITDFVLMSVGTGAVVGVPGHDIRDFEFAEQFGLDIVRVVVGSDGDASPIISKDQVQEHEGTMINSGFLDNMNIHDATKKMMDYLEKRGEGRKSIRYHLRDWLISRQRFWGCPIPIIYCDKCGIVPVPEKELPVKLPDNIKFKGKGNPLEDHREFVNVKCPKCNGNAKRETDTMDTFVDSSWYFLRYCDPKNSKKIFDSKKANYWMQIDQYIGGKEHACGHLIYFRFLTKFFHKLGLLKYDEPALRLFNQGMLHKNGVVMSKSKSNVVVPEEISKKYGIDTARLFLMFVSSPGKDMEWSDDGAEGSYRFLNKFYNLITTKKPSDIKNKKEISKLNKTIKEVTKYFETFEFNRAIISLMQFTNYLSKLEGISKECASALIRMFSPFIPHVCEELWESLGNKGFVSLEEWPKYDEAKIDMGAEASDILFERTRTDIANLMKLLDIRKPEKIKLITAFKWKYIFIKLIKKEMTKTREVKVVIQKCVKDPKLKSYSKEMSKLIPAILKDPRKVPETVLSQDKEKEELNLIKNKLKSLFGADIEIINAEGSTEEKAKQALPGKPAILIK